MDIGGGTQNLLLYDSRRSLENSVKLVLPTPSLTYAGRVREATRLQRDIFVKGDTIGGGSFASAIRDHLAGGNKVTMTPQTAYSIRNDLDEVREIGVEIVDEEPRDFRGETLQIQEVDISTLWSFLSGLDIAFDDIDAVAIAVQDHGVSPREMSNRRFRLREMEKALRKDPRLDSLSFSGGDVPVGFLRMRSAAKAVKRQLPGAKVLLMDTAPAAVLGCLADPVVNGKDPVMATNVGNCHTLAAVIQGGRVVGLAEHHTHSLTARKLGRLLRRLAEGNLTDEEVFRDNGHGSFLLSEPVGLDNLRMIVVTGPNRSMLDSARLRTYLAAPAGDMMVTGAVGLLEAAKKKFQLT